MKIDLTTLKYEIDRSATGANIHNLNQLYGKIKDRIEFIDKYPDHEFVAMYESEIPELLSKLSLAIGEVLP